MNTNHDNTSHDGRDDARLLWQLRGLRQDAVPVNDLWPGIAERIGAPGRAGRAVGAAMPAIGLAGTSDRRHGGSRIRRRPARFAPWALAASLALAVGLAWQLRPGPADVAVGSPGQLVDREADALTREYTAALRELQAAGKPSVRAGGALQQLDESAAQIRTALARDPGARFLLDRLRRTYEKRLELTQRAVLS